MAEARSLQIAGFISEFWIPPCLLEFWKHISDHPGYMDWDKFAQTLAMDNAPFLLSSYGLTPLQIGYRWWDNPVSRSYTIANAHPNAYPPGAALPEGANRSIIAFATWQEEYEDNQEASSCKRVLNTSLRARH